MSRIECGEVTIAIVATPKSPVSETGGAEVFTGTLANALAEQGFPVRIYGQENPNFPFLDGVTYIETSPTTNEIMDRDRVGLRRAINETGIAAPLRLATDIAEAPRDQRWAIIDNDTTSAPLAPLLSDRAPHIFVQHLAMSLQAHATYRRVQASGAKIVAIADYQREAVATAFGPLHDATIKNGINVQDFDKIPSRPYQRGEPIRVGTLSRIEPTDMKGVQFAARAVEKLREKHDAHLTIAGPVLPDRSTYDAVVAPWLGEYVVYVGEKRDKEKTLYLASLHVGAALSNPGGWDDEKKEFGLRFTEGNSLVLHEMIYAGAIPVSTDSGGAEPMKDAGLQDFVVPLDVIPKEGLDAFIDLSAQRMLEAAYNPVELPVLRSKIRTMEDVGRDYGEYILSLLAS